MTSFCFSSAASIYISSQNKQLFAPSPPQLISLLSLMSAALCGEKAPSSSKGEILDNVMLMLII
jgi:hypothetical protein